MRVPGYLLLLVFVTGCGKATEAPTPELKGRWDRVRIDHYYYNAAGAQIGYATGPPAVAAYIIIKDSTVEYYQTGNRTALVSKYVRVGNSLQETRSTGPQEIISLTASDLVLRTNNIAVMRSDTVRFEYEEFFKR